MKKNSIGISFAGFAMLAAVAPSVQADDAALPHQQLIAAIQTAIAAHPGQIQEVDVEKKSGKTVVEVTITGNDGKKKELTVDPEKNQVVR